MYVVIGNTYSVIIFHSEDALIESELQMRQNPVHRAEQVRVKRRSAVGTSN